MNADDFIGTAGTIVTIIESSEINESFSRLSQISDNWEIHSICPQCQRDIYFNKERINKIITCKCGKRLYLEIPEELL